MMGILGKLLGSDKAIETGIETVAKGLDALVYTNEEKAGDYAKSVTEARKMVIDWMAASQGHRLSRRVISLAITFVWLFMYVIGAILSVVAVWVQNAVQFKESARVIGDYADSMNGAVMLILGFYFAAPHLAEIVKPAMEKFSKRPDGDKKE